VERKKVLGFWDLVLFTFCAMFSVEAIAASAAIGPSAISWWLICAVGFFFPLGLVAAELGSTYPEQGGIYVWIKRGLGEKWAARSSWYYWICLPIWLPAMYIAVAEVIGHVFFPDVHLWFKICLAIIMIWITVGINLCSLKISKWVPNLGSVARFLLVTGMIAAAVAYFLKNRSLANQITLASIRPHLNSAVVFIPMIIYNLIGFELVSGAAGEMKNPQRDIPKAIILSAVIIVSLYLITTLVLWVIIPASQINVASGVLQVFAVTFGNLGIKQAILAVAGLLFALILFSGIIPWTLGDNRIVAEAARDGRLPRFLSKMSKNTAPLGAAFASGIISSAVIIIYGFIARNAAELFWHTISFSTVINLFTYLMLFPAFIILRVKDKNIKRPYRVPGPHWAGVFLAMMAEVFILLTVLVLILQPGHDFAKASLPIIIGIAITVAIGEVFISRSAA
jgi:amino acid transporter